MTPQTCCKSEQQVCCTDHRCQFPCPNNDEVPCLCFCCPFLTLFINWGCNVGCCRNLETMVPSPVPVQQANPTYVYVQQPAVGTSPPVQPIQGYAQPMYAKA